jgi:sulfur carrier protein
MPVLLCKWCYTRGAKLESHLDTKNMNIVVNGEALVCRDHLTVHDLLMEMGLVPETVIVELNTGFVQRSQYQTTIVSEGDSFEFIKFVGGG